MVVKKRTAKKSKKAKKLEGQNKMQGGEEEIGNFINYQFKLIIAKQSDELTESVKGCLKQLKEKYPQYSMTNTKNI